VELTVSLVLLTVYLATLAPSVSLWDAGEFNAAIASLGIPHPPGTPLYIVIGNVWTRGLGFIPSALALNLLSAVATAIACGLLGGLLAKWTRDRLAGIAGGLTAGSMLAVWNNATETEIYALSLLLAVLMVVVGDQAGERDSPRLRLLLAYLIGLAIPIQISALVAAPAAILLASKGYRSAESRVTSHESRSRALALGGVLAVTAGVALGSAGIIATGAILVAASALRKGARLEAVALVAIAALGMSATFFMLLRAQHDPFINQGDPSTFGAMMDVVRRSQYQVPGLWPRQAPVWIQLATLFQYADWQVASGLDNAVAASWWRTPWSLGALMLAVAGARWHWRQDRRSARGAAVLLLMSSLGIVAVLNLKAGPSILDSVLPPGAAHEPRERDYFFALAFATTGVWVGAGAVLAARRWLSPRAVPAALLLAGLPILLNWRAANRRPDAAIASTLGESLLASAPPNAMLLVAGDNDTYTIWYRQAVLGERRDVVPVTVSLLPAAWYRRELARRHRLLDSTTVDYWRGEEATLRALVTAARERGRPVAAAVTVPHPVRARLAPSWTLGGMAYVPGSETAPLPDAMDTLATRRVADLISRRIPASVRDRDPATSYVLRVLRCPSQALRSGGNALDASPELTLDSRCNFK